MANHVRHQLRELTATLLTGLSVTGPRVFQSRVYPLQESELPCLLVETGEEENEYLTVSFPRRVKRTVRLTIKALAKSRTDVDDTLDAICKDVESTICGDPFLGGFAKDTKLKGTPTGLNGEGEVPIGAAVMMFEVEIHTRENAPDVAI